MKRFLLLFVLTMAYTVSVPAQIRIADCQERARENYPLIKKYGLIEQAEKYTLSNAQKGYLPQIQANAKATYQSEVTKVPISFPGLDIPTQKKDQYSAVVEANQALWDGGVIQARKRIAKADSEMEKQQLEVELYAVEERVNQLFFGILLFDSRLMQNQILIDELERSYKRVADYMKNGIANQADLDAVKVEQLNARQTRTQLQSTRAAYVEMLSIMTGESFGTEAVFVKPELALPNITTDLNRPELQFFEAQTHFFDAQRELIKSAYMPKLGLFIQGGYGRPALNMLSDKFEAFYVGGIRMTWNFGSLYTKKNDFQKIEINKKTVDVQRDLFLYNIRLKESAENRDIQRIIDLMKDDKEIISLRENIRKSAEAKVANGTITVTDLLQEISREDMAHQTKATHEIDLLIAIYNLKNTKNLP